MTWTLRTVDLVLLLFYLWFVLSHLAVHEYGLRSNRRSTEVDWIIRHAWVFLAYAAALTIGVLATGFWAPQVPVVVWACASVVTAVVTAWSAVRERRWRRARG